MIEPAAVRDILLATDFSEASEPAVQAARAYARAFGARVHVLHVAAPGTEGLTLLMSGLTAMLGPDTVVRSVVGGAPATEIVRYARDHPIDLIVMGTHGRTGMSRALLGSVAERVVRTAPCAVLTVPASALRPATAPVEEVVVEPRHCLVCAAPSEDLICEPCRARIRGEAVERKQRDERAGRR
jgi:nucleotide-binding universal stress UspA family protein